MKFTITWREGSWLKASSASKKTILENCRVKPHESVSVYWKDDDDVEHFSSNEGQLTVAVESANCRIVEIYSEVEKSNKKKSLLADMLQFRVYIGNPRKEAKKLNEEVGYIDFDNLEEALDCIAQVESAIAGGKTIHQVFEEW